MSDQHAHDEAAEADVLAMLLRLGTAGVLAETLGSLVTIAQVRMGAVPGAESLRDLPEAKRAIDAVGAIRPHLDGQVDPAFTSEVRQVEAQLKLVYAQSLAQTGGQDDDETGAAQAERPGIWTPRGEV